MKIIATLLFVLLAASASSEPLLQKPGLVDTAWLEEHLTRPEIRIVDARSSLRPYMQGHIPGAIYLNTETVRISEGGVPARLLPPGQLAEMFGKMGIGHQHTVVIYSSGEENFSHATYVAYLLEWLGHEAVGVLDGGFEKWSQEGREVTRKFPAYQRASFEPQPNATLLTAAREVQSAVASGSAHLLDARQVEQFEAGHIPTASTFFLAQTLEGNEVKTWKSPNALRALAAEAGVTEDRPIITYCTSGRESAQIWFTLRHVAGFANVSSYHGSWIDWTAKGLPIASSR